jgi:hypothetical protein
LTYCTYNTEPLCPSRIIRQACHHIHHRTTLGPAGLTAICRNKTKNPSSMGCRMLAHVQRLGELFFFTLANLLIGPLLGTWGLVMTRVQAPSPYQVVRLASSATSAIHAATPSTMPIKGHKDHNPPLFHCHIDRCPRSIQGRGFRRKDKLVDHLKSKKAPHHGLSHKDAVFQAALHSTSYQPGNYYTTMHGPSNQDSVNLADRSGS